MIEKGDLSKKPGWIRLSLHPTMTNNELMIIIDAIKQTVENIHEWQNDYFYDKHTNEFHHVRFPGEVKSDYSSWFRLDP